jgi:secreted trypsin-like serine protease
MHSRRLAILWAPALLGAILAAPIAAQEKFEPPKARIVGGEPTDIAKHPWQVALNIDIDGNRHLCGGSIVADRWVLTAAHCFERKTAPKDVKAKAGATKYKKEGDWLDAERVVIHEGYNAKTHEHDLALIRLRTLPAGKVIAKVIPLASPTMAIPVGQKLEVTGWGAASEGGGVESSLLKAEVPYVVNDACNVPSAYDGKIKPGMLCAGLREGGVDACQGDSGGPLVWHTENGPVLVGVVSWGIGCARKLRYGVYTRTTSYADWIGKVVSSSK